MTVASPSLELTDFDYELPRSSIAQEPIRERVKARLLVLSRADGRIEHRNFADIVEYLEPGDCLVLNDTKVVKARLFGRKETGGRVEVLLHRKLADQEWEALIKPSGRVRQGASLEFRRNGFTLWAEVLDAPRPDSGLRRIQLVPRENLPGLLESIGRLPLPPYIDRPDTDIDREYYQTVFAKKEGAVASPTAGLHFDQPLLDDISAKGVEIVFVTLHVGYGTFQPVTTREIERHKMHPEAYEISTQAACRLNDALRTARRIVACGTTVVKVLESCASRDGKGLVNIRPGSGETDLFIYPPYPFLVVQSLITNFHLPRTTLLMLASAFAGREALALAYGEAIRSGYRFYSYGDAMLIL